MGSIYVRGGTYWIKYYRNGKPYRESTHDTKESKAKRLLALREGQVAVGQFPGLKVERTTFVELAEDYLTDYKVNGRKSIRQAEIRIGHLKGCFGMLKANQIDTPAVNRYIELRQNQGAENATINRELTALKRMFSLALKCTPPKVLRMPHITKLREANVRTGYFEQQDYLKIRDALPDHLKPLFVTAYFTGLRKGELLSLTWDRVNLFERKISLEAGTTKNDEARVIFLAGELYDTLRAHYTTCLRETPNCPYVFQKGGYQLTDFRKAWERALRRCGYKASFKCRDCGAIVQIEPSARWRKEGPTVYLSEGEVKNAKTVHWEELMCARCKSTRFKRNNPVFHDNRRTAVRNLVRTGTPEGVAMKISGHRTRTIFERYNIVSEDDLRIASERLALAHQEGTEKAQQAHDRHNLGTIGLVK
jgi:integrase